ncbi:glycosyltransferase family 32 protein [Fodinibius sp. Rm-B-1B1-1]|uniref:glycosyltransferase family 32 protein n=1 Tax=Fodinibius alkaliphilus TaxID=3140241 RepID=UPI00315A6037
MYKPSKEAISISENDHKRSDKVCDFIKTYKGNSIAKGTIPKIIIQYWDNPKQIPKDVNKCVKTWDKLDSKDYKHLLFNDYSARKLIANKFNQRHVKAYDHCYHPAMKSDYFRLCFIHSYGGCYIDTDDAYCGTNIEHLFNDARLKLQPLCYDVSTNSMVDPNKFTKPKQYSTNWIFYFNNNPIIAPPKNPIIQYALKRATDILLKPNHDNLPDIQSTTGPGNLTASVVAQMTTSNSYEVETHFRVLTNWANYIDTIWSLRYRNDNRNWRLSNKKNFYRE